MKKIFIAIFMLLSINDTKAQALQDTLLRINFNQYLNKPIDSLLMALPNSYDSIYTRAGSSFFVGAVIVVNYGHSNIWVYIYPGTQDFFTPLNASHNPPHIAWPLHLVRKEKAWKMSIRGLGAQPLVEICCGD